MRIRTRCYCALMILLGVWGGRALSQGLNSNAPVSDLVGVGIEQKLDETIPLDLLFYDSDGRQVRLGDYFGEKPVILAPVYYECPMLCTLILNGLLKSLNALSFDAGDEFTVVTFSFDPEEKPDVAGKKKKTYLNKYAREGADSGWFFLTGDRENIKALTDAIGFSYRYDETSEEFVHASAIMVLTPEGRLSRYFYGVEYSSRDLKFAMLEASENRIGSPVDQLLLYCYHYDPTTGKYGVAIMNVIRVLGTLTVVVLVSFMVIMLWRDKKKAIAFEHK